MSGEKSIQTETDEQSTYPLSQAPVLPIVREKQDVLPAASVISSLLEYKKKNPDSGRIITRLILNFMKNTFYKSVF